ncbi:MAG: formylglycine-generating enzyme family protein [Bacteroidia bacterium]|nr:formylglycine-generating enzyme family protein [Bacteroidia bacterium]
MKIQSIFISLIFFLSTVFSLKAQTLSPFEMQFVKINDSVYASRFEVSNDEYMQFMTTIDRKNKLFSKVKVDSLGWNCCINMKELSDYHRHSSFSDYPVVNIPYEGAVEYCKWLTRNYAVSVNPNFKNAVFRLPSEIEWEIAAQGGIKENIYGFEGVEIMDAKGNLMCNFKDITAAVSSRKSHKNQMTMTDHHVITAPVKFYKPNALGVYNMSGNVAEMTLEKGYSKGGSWFSPRDKVEISQFEMYEKPEPFVGFRVFMVVKK